VVIPEATPEAIFIPEAEAEAEVEGMSMYVSSKEAIIIHTSSFHSSHREVRANKC
jgi:hypothetical protein